MTDLAVKAVMTLDASGVPAGATTAKAALDSLKASHEGLSGSAKLVTGATRELSAANDEAGISAYRFDQAMLHLSGGMGYHVMVARDFSRAMHELVGGLGLVNAGALAGGAGFLFLLGHTTAAKQAMADLGEVVDGAWNGFDRLVSGTNAVARAQAEGVVAANDWLAKFQQISAAQEKLGAAIGTGENTSPALASALRLSGRALNIMAPNVLPDFGATPEQISSYKRSNDGLSQQYTEEFDKRFGIVNKGTQQEFGITPEDFKTNKDISEHYTRFSVELDKQQAEAAKAAAAKAAADAARMTTSFDESDNRFIHDFKPQGITGFDTPAERQFATGNPLGIQTNGVAQRSQEINDASETEKAVSGAIFDEIKQRIQMQGEYYDHLHEQEVHRIDDVRQGFEQFGVSALTNFNNAGQAAEQFLTKLEQMAIQMYVMQPLTNALLGVQGPPGVQTSGLISSGGGGLVNSLDLAVGGPGLGGGGAGLLSDVGSFLSSIFHTGGIVGEGGASRYMHPSYFDRAPRFHSGGIAGDEVPIVATKGEGVFTPGQMAALGGASRGGGPAVSVNVHNYSGQKARVNQTTDANGNMNFDVLIDQVDAAMADRASRGGSQFTRMLENNYSLGRTPG